MVLINVKLWFWAGLEANHNVSPEGAEFIDFLPWNVLELGVAHLEKRGFS